MTWSKLLPALIYLGAVFLYLWASTQFKPGWARRGIALWWGARINILLFLFVVFVVLLIVAFETSK